MSALLHRPDMDIKAIRKLPTHIRLHWLLEILDFFVPRPEVIDIEQEVSVMIRQGYIRRNPTRRSAQHAQYTVADRMRAQGALGSPLPPCLMVAALSGSGKTRSLYTVLSQIPQTIRHGVYDGQRLGITQICWLSLDAPISGSSQGLILRMFGALDAALGLTGSSSYVQQFGKSRKSVDEKIELFARAASTYKLGLLHIDDLQRLVDGGLGTGRQVLNLLIQLANVVQVPLVLSGTYRMANLVATSFEASRRTTSAGYIDMLPPKDHQDEHFTAMCIALFKHQILTEQIKLDESMLKTLFDLSVGLPAVLVTVFYHAQKLALKNDIPRLSETLLRDAFDQNCMLLKPALAALKGSNPDRYHAYEDLLPPRAEIERLQTMRFKATRNHSMAYERHR